MTSLVFALSLIVALDEAGEKPVIVFDSRPETGVPAEALAQIHAERPEGEARLAGTWPPKFHDQTEGTIKTVRIRYFNKDTWAADEQARDYVAGFLAHESLEGFGFQIWSQSVGVPEIECVIDFTEEHRKHLLEQQKPCGEGRLLIWNTEACFRDATGRWWFVSAFDHFHRSHPRGDRKLAKPVKEKPE